VSRLYTPRPLDRADMILDWMRCQEPPVSLARIQSMAMTRWRATPEEVAEALVALVRRGDVTSEGT